MRPDYERYAHAHLLARVRAAIADGWTRDGVRYPGHMLTLHDVRDLLCECADVMAGGEPRVTTAPAAASREVQMTFLEDTA